VFLVFVFGWVCVCFVLWVWCGFFVVVVLGGVLVVVVLFLVVVVGFFVGVGFGVCGSLVGVVSGFLVSGRGDVFVGWLLLLWVFLVLCCVFVCVVCWFVVVLGFFVGVV
ncbi:hypothetical protein, partial [Escherichia coli]|uniref:hypothetical protein n=1 Tax=Escherichia coli TaxID=562 RepID=UPI001BFC67AD